MHCQLIADGMVVALLPHSRLSASTTNHSKKEATMKSGNRDKAEGKLHEIKGKVKEKAGKLTDNPKLEIEGTDEKIAGKIQGDVGDIKKALGK